MEIEGIETPHKRAAKVKKMYKDKLGEPALELAGYLRDICHPYSFGVYDSRVGTGRFRHNKDYLERARWPKKLSATEVYGHFLSPDKTGMIWYTNSLPFFERGKRRGRLALYVLDIDFKESGISDASEMLRHLQCHQRALNGLYAEASTNGNGIHLYAPVLFPSTWTNSMVNDWAKAYQAYLTDISNQGQRDYGIRSSCKEVRGMSPLIKGRDYITMGTLAKLPRISSMESASILLDSLNHPIDFSVLCDFLPYSSLIETGENQNQNQRQKDNNKERSPSCFPLGKKTTSGLSQRQINSSGDIYSIEEREGGIPSLHNPEDKLKNKGDAFERMRVVAQELARNLNRVPNELEILEAYEASGLANTPERHKAREQRARKICAYLSKHFVPAKSVPPLSYLPEIEKLVTDSLIKTEYKAKRGKDARLTHSDIALVYYLIKENTGKVLPKKWFQAASRNLKKEGKVSRTLDDKKLAASKRILKRVGLISYTAAKAHVKCSRYTALDIAKTYPISNDNGDNVEDLGQCA